MSNSNESQFQSELLDWFIEALRRQPDFADGEFNFEFDFKEIDDEEHFFQLVFQWGFADLLSRAKAKDEQLRELGHAEGVGLDLEDLEMITSLNEDDDDDDDEEDEDEID